MGYDGDYVRQTKESYADDVQGALFLALLNINRPFETGNTTLTNLKMASGYGLNGGKHKLQVQWL